MPSIQVDPAAQVAAAQPGSMVPAGQQESSPFHVKKYNQGY